MERPGSNSHTETKSFKKGGFDLALVVLMTLGTSVTPAASGEAPDCEELLAEIVGNVGDVDTELLEKFALECEPCEILEDCPIGEIQTTIAAMTWGHAEPGTQPDVVAITFVGCEITDFAGSLGLLTHPECEIYVSSLIWPDLFDAYCILWEGADKWAGTLTVMGVPHKCDLAEFIPVVGCVGTTVAEVALISNDPNPAIGTGVGVARC